MATAGYGMKYGKGYLGGGGGASEHEPETPQETEGGGDEAIKQHLEERHAETGHAHSHVEHHGDGRHTSHHISEGGEHSGPHEHDSLDSVKQHMASMSGEEQEGGEDDGEGFE